MARVIINKDGNINCIFGFIGVCSRLPRMASHQERQRMAQESVRQENHGSIRSFTRNKPHHGHWHSALVLHQEWQEVAVRPVINIKET